jgi:hypothetical protein
LRQAAALSNRVDLDTTVQRTFCLLPASSTAVRGPGAKCRGAGIKRVALEGQKEFRAQTGVAAA